MLAYALSSSTWWTVAFLTVVSVLTMLGMMAKILSYELTLIEVASSARVMRTKLQHSIDKAEQENNPQSAEASQAPKDAKASTAEDQPEDVQPTADDTPALEDDEPSSDEISAHNADPNSPDELTSNADQTEPSESPETVESAAA